MTGNFTSGTIIELQVLLRRHGFDPDKYGVGKAKTLEHLFREVQSGECSLFAEGCALVRDVQLVGLNITREGRVLEEQFQEFYEGNRRRTRKLDASAGEKMKPEETPNDTVRRLIKEEFPILLGNLETLIRGDDLSRREESFSYPGLITQYTIHLFSIELTIELPSFVVMEPDKWVGYDWTPRP